MLKDCYVKDSHPVPAVSPPIASALPYSLLRRYHAAAALLKDGHLQSCAATFALHSVREGGGEAGRRGHLRGRIPDQRREGKAEGGGGRESRGDRQRQIVGGTGCLPLLWPWCPTAPCASPRGAVPKIVTTQVGPLHGRGSLALWFLASCRVFPPVVCG